MTRIELMKKDVNTQNPLSGAVYGIYTDKKCENLLMTMSATGTDGKAVSDYFDSALKTVYVKEITAPTGYKLNTEVYKVAVTAGKTMTVTATDERVTGKVKIAKIDKETLAFKAQGTVFFVVLCMVCMQKRTSCIRMAQQGFCINRTA